MVDRSQPNSNSGPSAGQGQVGERAADDESQGQGIFDSARDAGKAAFDAASSQASALTSSVVDELAKTGEKEKQRGADVLSSFAASIGRVAADLDDNVPLAGDRLRSASDSVGRFADRLKDRDVRDLVGDASEYAHRQPWTFFIGAMVAGFAISRFVKSSAHSSTMAASQRSSGE